MLPSEGRVVGRRRTCERLPRFGGPALFRRPRRARQRDSQQDGRRDDRGRHAAESERSGLSVGGLTGASASIPETADRRGPGVSATWPLPESMRSCASGLDADVVPGFASAASQSDGEDRAGESAYTFLADHP